MGTEGQRGRAPTPIQAEMGPEGRRSGAAALRPSSSLPHALLQLQLPPPLGAGLYDGLIFLLLKLLAQVPARPSPFSSSPAGAVSVLGAGRGADRNPGEQQGSPSTPPPHLQEDGAVEQGFAASELWSVLWHGVAAVLRVGAEPEGETPGAQPDWNLLSPQGRSCGASSICLGPCSTFCPQARGAQGHFSQLAACLTA